MIPFNYHHLYYFYVIAKEGSIAKACQTLYLAQTTLSLQLKQFEKFLGRQLFQRVKQRLILTEDGRLVLDYAESIFEIGREMQDTLKDRPTTGKMAVQLGILNGTPRAFGQALLEWVLASFPNAHVVVREGDTNNLLEELHQHRIDAFLTDVSIRIQNQEELNNHLVGKVPVVFAASPQLAKRYPHIPKDLDGAPLILPSHPSQVYSQILDLLAEWKVTPRIIVEVQDVELARRLALKGHGIVPLNAYSVSVSLPTKGLVVLGNGKSPKLYESVYLVTRKRKWPNPIIEQMVKKFRVAPLPE